MPVRDTVRDAQRQLVLLDAAHTRAVARLHQAVARRTQVMADQDRLVKAAEADVERTVAEMASVLGPELTANLLGVEPVDIRRAVAPDRPKRSDRSGR
jgi:hypothetical protein